ncbi:MAG: ATP-binding protein [Synechococcales bacterium]|nr:ATP-binding protein [Synechococcales bacterium]
MLICHVLIGIPGSGKTTFAQAWIAHNPRYIHISTDRIRAQLYGDAAIQGNWADIENEVLQQIKAAIAAQRPVIYDATNAKRQWRMHFLQQVRSLPCLWIGWRMTTDLETCLARNQQRDRQVPESVIQQLHSVLTQEIPQISEGFAATHIPPFLQTPLGESVFDFTTIDRWIAQIEVIH